MNWGIPSATIQTRQEQSNAHKPCNTVKCLNVVEFSKVLIIQVWLTRLALNLRFSGAGDLFRTINHRLLINNLHPSLAGFGLGLRAIDGLSCGPILFVGPGDTDDDLKPNP